MRDIVYLMALAGLAFLPGCLPETVVAEDTPDCQAPLVAVQDRDNDGNTDWDCVMPTGDGGQACNRSTDCVSYCVAETRTCLPTANHYFGGVYLDRFGREIDGGRISLVKSCEEQGGVLAFSGSSGAATCDYPAADGGEACDSALDCDGFCVAESRTCTSYITDNFCAEVLDDNGQVIDGRSFSFCG